MNKSCEINQECEVDIERYYGRLKLVAYIIISTVVSVIFIKVIRG